MRALILLPSIIRGGSEEYALRFADYLQHRNHSVQLAFPATPGTSSLREGALLSGIHCLSLPADDRDSAGRIIDISRQTLHAQAVLASTRPDAVVIVAPRVQHVVGLMIAAARMKLPTLVIFMLCYKLDKISGTLRSQCQQIESRQEWVAVSYHNRRFVSRSFRVPEQRIHVIHNGAPLDTRYHSLSATAREALRREVRRELLLPPTASIALIVARLSADKGHADVLHAARHLNASGHSITFLFVGDGELRGRLEERVARMQLQEQVRFLGYRGDIPRLLVAADVFVFPSRAEGLSFALVESMAYGTPIVCANATSNTEAIRPNVDGCTYEPGNADELADRIRLLFASSQLARKVSMSAYRRYRDYFTADEMWHSTMELLDHAVHRHSPL